LVTFVVIAKFFLLLSSDETTRYCAFNFFSIFLDPFVSLSSWLPLLRFIIPYSVLPLEDGIYSYGKLVILISIGIAAETSSTC